MWCFKSDHSGPQLLCIYVQCWSNFFIYTSSFIAIRISWLNLCSSPQPLCVWEELTFCPVYMTQVTTQPRVGTGWSAFCAGRQLKNWICSVLILCIPLAVLWEVHIHLAGLVHHKASPKEDQVDSASISSTLYLLHYLPIQLDKKLW